MWRFLLCVAGVGVAYGLYRSGKLGAVMAYVPKLQSDLDAAIFRAKTKMEEAIDQACDEESWKRAYYLRQEYLQLVEARDQRILEQTKARMEKIKRAEDA